MLNQLRHQIQGRLDELLGEAEKLRHALASRDGAATPPASAAPTAERARRRTSSAPAPPRASAAAAGSPQSAQPPAAAVPGPTAPGATKAAALKAISGGSAMTAGELAAATGLRRATVSTTLSKLAKSGELTKSRPRLPARRPDSARHAGRRERAAERLSQEARHHQPAGCRLRAGAVRRSRQLNRG
ncbi:MAG: MarR family transcriptional regulator [Solirubrobacteraceae bacterium]